MGLPAIELDECLPLNEEAIMVEMVSSVNQSLKLEDKLLCLYHEFLHLFSREAADWLPPYTGYNPTINILGGKHPP